MSAASISVVPELPLKTKKSSLFSEVMLSEVSDLDQVSVLLYCASGNEPSISAERYRLAMDNKLYDYAAC